MPGEFSARVQIDPVALAAALRAPTGGLTRDLLNKGELVKREAQRRVGVYKPDPRDPFARKRIAKRRPGTLRDSIVKRIVPKGHDGLPAVLVGSDDPIALLHHEGTSRHTIVARRAPQLVFYSGKAGRVVKTKRVNHPGTAPNRYLTDALRVIPRR